ncbi:defensin-like protein 1 [Mercurialis annua]|uniref:defensin-like protein 1 n=1 Tax=Mercurialis annua TaxID=3986 RepID=UPI00215FE032|nr:defensin-like protein 1 [Mercurialis annua]
MEKRFFGVLLLLLILFTSQEVMVPAEARVCESPSHYFKGPCARDHNCAMVCRNEAFSGGRCKGFRRRCLCTKLC